MINNGPKAVRGKEEIQLEEHARNEIKKLKLKLKSVNIKEKKAIEEEKILTEDCKVIENKILQLKDKMKQCLPNEKAAVDSTINENELMRSEKEKALLLKRAELNAIAKKKELLESWQKLHENFLKQLTINVARNYLATRHTDMEHLLDSLYLHHKHVQNSGLYDKTHGKESLGGLKQMIQKSNSDLTALEKSPPARDFDIADPRQDVFSPVWEIIKDNINLRKSLNNSVDALLEQSTRKLEEIVQREDTPLKYASDLLEKRNLVRWTLKTDTKEKLAEMSQKQEKARKDMSVRIRDSKNKVKKGVVQWLGNDNEEIQEELREAVIPEDSIESNQNINEADPNEEQDKKKSMATPA